MTDSGLKVEPGDVVLEGGDNGDEGNEDDADVNSRSKSSCIVPGGGESPGTESVGCWQHFLFVLQLRLDL